MPHRVRWVRTLALGISRNVIRILQPPGISQVSLCQVQASNGFGHSTRHTGIGRQVLDSGQQVGEDGLGVHFGHGIAHGGT